MKAVRSIRFVLVLALVAGAHALDPAGADPAPTAAGNKAQGGEPARAEDDAKTEGPAKDKDAENKGDKAKDAAAAAPAPAANAKAKVTASANSVCLLVESAARAHGLPLEFFARVIWQESRFRPDAIGPVTRSGERAQGIAQFMPGTAAERRLLDPLDPVQALPKSAEFLKELRAEFGNLGLAAAAYNAGPRRVREWLDGTGPMPSETRNYVAAITGLSVDDWAALRAKPGAQDKPRPALGCGQLIALLKRTPNPFVAGLERRVRIAVLKPWGVQLAAGFSRSRALASYARVVRQYGSVLRGRDPNILSTVSRSRGMRAFYQVRIGADTRSAADQLCDKIRSAGGACMVLRNTRNSG